MSLWLPEPEDAFNNEPIFPASSDPSHHVGNRPLLTLCRDSGLLLQVPDAEEVATTVSRRLRNQSLWIQVIAIRQVNRRGSTRTPRLLCRIRVSLSRCTDSRCEPLVGAYPGHLSSDLHHVQGFVKRLICPKPGDSIVTTNLRLSSSLVPCLVAHLRHRLCFSRYELDLLRHCVQVPDAGDTRNRRSRG